MPTISPYSSLFPAYNLGNVPNLSQTLQNVLGTVKGIGNSEAEQAKINYQNALGTSKQSLASSGLLGTSVAPSLEEGFYKQYQQVLDQIGNQMQQTIAGYQAQIGGQAAQLGQSGQQASQQFGLEYMRAMQGLGGRGGVNIAGSDPSLSGIGRGGGGGGFRGGGGGVNVLDPLGLDSGGMQKVSNVEGGYTLISGGGGGDGGEFSGGDLGYGAGGNLGGLDLGGSSPYDSSGYGGDTSGGDLSSGYMDDSSY